MCAKGDEDKCRFTFFVSLFFLYVDDIPLTNHIQKFRFVKMFCMNERSTQTENSSFFFIESDVFSSHCLHNKDNFVMIKTSATLSI